jgi:hypothetical protein
MAPSARISSTTPPAIFFTSIATSRVAGVAAALAIAGSASALIWVARSSASSRGTAAIPAAGDTRIASPSAAGSTT